MCKIIEDVGLHQIVSFDLLEQGQDKPEHNDNICRMFNVYCNRGLVFGIVFDDYTNVALQKC